MLKDADKALQEYLVRRPQDREYLTGYFQRHPEHKAEMVEQLLRNEVLWEKQRQNPSVYKALTPEKQVKLEEILRRWDEMMFD